MKDIVPETLEEALKLIEKQKLELHVFSEWNNCKIGKNEKCNKRF